MNSIKSTTQKRKQHDKNHKSQNITLKKKDIINTSIFKIQKKQKCAFNHNAQIQK